MQSRLLYIECGTTMRSSVNTGIQRVVKNIVRSSKEIEVSCGFNCVLVEHDGTAFRPVTEISKPHSGGSSPAVVVDRLLWKVTRAVDRFCGKVLPGRLYFRVRDKYKLKAKLLLGQVEIDCNNRFSLIDHEGDRPILLLLDSTWDNSIWSQIDRFRSEGGFVCAVLYDLIPFSHPETVADSTRVAHTSWWSVAPDHLDAIMCISKSVRQEYLEWQAKRSFSHPVPANRIGYFYLGSDVSVDDPVARVVTEDVSYFLVVGSLEPRKNHKTIIAAFNILWDRGVRVRLVIVGAFGWKSDELISTIKAHPKFGIDLFLVRDASDRDLTILYAGAIALVIASVAEGFGLPIVEAYKHGKTVICSDIPVFHEVGGEAALYFNTLDPAALAGRVNEVMAHKAPTCTKVRAPSSVAPISWGDSAKQLLKGIALVSK